MCVCVIRKQNGYRHFLSRFMLDFFNEQIFCGPLAPSNPRRNWIWFEIKLCATINNRNEMKNFRLKWLKMYSKTAAGTGVDSMKNVASVEMYARITSRVRLTLKIENVRELRSVYLVCLTHIQFCISLFFLLHSIHVSSSIESKI